MLKNLKRLYISHCLLIVFCVQCFSLQPIQAQELTFSKAAQPLVISPAAHPVMLKGLKVHADNPFKFEFVMQKQKGAGPFNAFGDLSPSEANKLIKYFLASLTIPEKDLWVNLSPYEKNRIIPDVFGQTEMGRDLLAQDYMLKQITASLMNPEGEIGKEFWKKIYLEAAKLQKQKGAGPFNVFGDLSPSINISTFNKVWIVPDKAVVYENSKAGTAYVVESKLKVMMEEDYLSMEKNMKAGGSSLGLLPAAAGGHADCKATPRGDGCREDKRTKVLTGPASITSQMMKEIIIPELTRTVNDGQHFAQLRQVYNSLILATWYKKKLKDSILNQVYSNKNKIKGIGYQKGAGPFNAFGDLSPSLIYQQYLTAFKKGAYNLIKEEQDPVSQQIILRKYFSGGFNGIRMDAAMVYVQDRKELSGDTNTDKVVLAVDLSFDKPLVADSAQISIEERNAKMREAIKTALKEDYKAPDDYFKVAVVGRSEANFNLHIMREGELVLKIDVGFSGTIITDIQRTTCIKDKLQPYIDSEAMLRLIFIALGTLPDRMRKIYINIELEANKEIFRTFFKRYGIILEEGTNMVWSMNLTDAFWENVLSNTADVPDAAMLGRRVVIGGSITALLGWDASSKDVLGPTSAADSKAIIRRARRPNALEQKMIFQFFRRNVDIFRLINLDMDMVNNIFREQSIRYDQVTGTIVINGADEYGLIRMIDLAYSFSEKDMMDAIGKMGADKFNTHLKEAQEAGYVVKQGNGDNVSYQVTLKFIQEYLKFTFESTSISMFLKGLKVPDDFKGFLMDNVFRQTLNTKKWGSLDEMEALALETASLSNQKILSNPLPIPSVKPERYRVITKESDGSYEINFSNYYWGNELGNNYVFLNPWVIFPLLSRLFVSVSYDDFESKAMLSSMNGGIDLSAAKARLKTVGEDVGIKFYLDPAQVARWKESPGVNIRILSIKPLKDLNVFLGVIAGT